MKPPSTIEVDPVRFEHVQERLRVPLDVEEAIADEVPSRQNDGVEAPFAGALETGRPARDC